MSNGIKRWVGVLVCAMVGWSACGEVEKVDLAEKQTAGELRVQNRALDPFMAEGPGEIYMTKGDGDGLVWIEGVAFDTGALEFEVKGREQGMSFVGIAFAGDDAGYEAVYFRPFNFSKQDVKSGKSVQYIAMPGNDWKSLRDRFPGVYESSAVPTPSGADWFKVRMVVTADQVHVYIDGSEQGTLTVQRIPRERGDAIGFWVGNQSDGWFRNLVINRSKD